jgi:hypothetical protein
MRRLYFFRLAALPSKLGGVEADAGEVELLGVLPHLELVARVGEVLDLVGGRVDPALLDLGRLGLELLPLLFLRELARLVVAVVLELALHHLGPDAGLDLGRVGDGLLREDAHHVGQLDLWWIRRQEAHLDPVLVVPQRLRPPNAAHLLAFLQRQAVSSFHQKDTPHRPSWSASGL